MHATPIIFDTDELSFERVEDGAVVKSRSDKWMCHCHISIESVGIIRNLGR